MAFEKQTGPTDLRRLGFVAVYSESIAVKAVSIADRLYQAVRVRAPLPSFVDDRLKIAEGKFTEFSTPAVSFIQDRATQVLTIVDTKVDQSVGLAAGIYEQTIGSVPFPAYLKGTRDNYVKRAVDLFGTAKNQSITGTVEYVKGMVGYAYTTTVQFPATVRNQAHAAIDRTTTYVVNFRDSVTAGKVYDAAVPTMEYAKEKYITVHRRVVTTPVYKQMYDVSTTVIHKVQDLSLVQTVYSVSANRLYPYVKPYASPLVLKAQPYVDEVVQQLKPISVAA